MNIYVFVYVFIYYMVGYINLCGTVRYIYFDKIKIKYFI